MRKWFIIAAIGDLIIIAIIVWLLTGCATHKPSWHDHYDEVYPGCIVYKKI